MGRKAEFLRVETLEKLRKLRARLVSFHSGPVFPSLLNGNAPRRMDAAVRDSTLLVLQVLLRTPIKPSQAVIYMRSDIRRGASPASVDDTRGCTVLFFGGWEPRRDADAAFSTGHDGKSG